jgi:hypothetical protein
MRPLRVISKYEDLKLLVNALFQTLPILSSLLYFLSIFIWVTGIIFHYNLKNGFYYCKLNDPILI